MDQPPPPSQSQTASSAPQIRSRITVVCAECKRLKLKCDRRSPCSSCTKRDTVARCIYSPAAAEKVDLHSLNNRLMQVEATLAQITAGTFQSSYPPAHPVPSALPPPPPALPFPPSSHQHHHHPAAVAAHVHDEPCPLVLSLDELRAAWLDNVENARRSALGRPPHPIKVDLSPADVERQTRLKARHSAGLYPHSRHLNPQPFLPALGAYYPTPTQPFASSSYAPPAPTLTPAVLNLLPSTSLCMRLLTRAKPVLAQRPLPVPGGWTRFEQKTVSLLSNRTASPSFGGSTNASDVEGESSRPSSANPREKKKAEQDLPFFAIVTAVLAIGAAVSPPEVLGPENVNAGFLYAISQQTLSVWESSTAKKPEKDYVLFLVACLAGIGYLLLVTPDQPDEAKEDSGGKPRAIFALVGKMVNVAREIGLGKEKAPWQDEERPTMRSDSRQAWEDIRRVIWWDVMFYDLFTSDALGHPSLIPPLSHSAKLPELTGNTYDPVVKKYVIARCRLVQLSQRIKHRLSHPDCCCGYTFDQAAALDDDIRRWSRECISSDDNNNDGDKSDDRNKHTWELSLVAQILVLRVYVPFLISANSAAAARKQQAIGGGGGSGIPSGRVPGKGGLGEKSQIQGNAMAMATQACLGAAQVILRLGNKFNASLFKEPTAGPSPAVNIDPLLLDLYPLERLVLDAVVITQSSTAVSVVSEAEVRRGMEIMMDREFALGRERKEIWEMMKQRVSIGHPHHSHHSSHHPQHGKLQISTTGMHVGKRKHDQLSPVLASSGGAGELAGKRETKHAKTSGPTPIPVMGIRVRPGRMGPGGPIRPPQQQQSDYVNSARSYTLSEAQADSTMTAQLQHPIPHSAARPSIGGYDGSPAPTEYVSSATEQQQQVMQVQTPYSLPEHPMAGHRNSFDQTQTKSIYNLEEGPMSSNGYHQDYSNSGTATHPNSSSSSPYQATTPTYNNNNPSAPHHHHHQQQQQPQPQSQFGSSPADATGPSSASATSTSGGSTTATNRTPCSSQDSPVSSFDSAAAKFGSGPSGPPFESARAVFMADNAQAAQVYAEPAPVPAQSMSPEDTAGGAAGTADGVVPPAFGVPQAQAPQPHDASGYFHPHHAHHHVQQPPPPQQQHGGPYDGAGMMPIGMRMDEGSVPGTPIYGGDSTKQMQIMHQQQQHVSMQAFDHSHSHHAQHSQHPAHQHSHPHSHQQHQHQHQQWPTAAQQQGLVGAAQPPYW